MNQLKKYVVNQKTILLAGEYTQYGRLYTRVVEGDQSMLVELPPISVLIDTLHYYGKNLKGAIEGAKSILGKVQMCPIIVSDVQDICLFPHVSPERQDCIWFSHKHVIKTHSHGRCTVVELSNGRSLLVSGKLAAFNSKKQKAGDLRRIVHERSHSLMTLDDKPKRAYLLCPMTGRIRFDEE